MFMTYFATALKLTRFRYADQAEMTHTQSPAASKLYSMSESDSSPRIKSRKLYFDEGNRRSVKTNAKHKRRNKLNHRKGKHISKYTVPCESEFVSSRRLTRKVGLFNYGKSSTVVSRLQHATSAETKARIDQDLQEILNLANHTEHAKSQKLSRDSSVNVKLTSRDTENSVKTKLGQYNHSFHKIKNKNLFATPSSKTYDSERSPKMHVRSVHSKSSSQSDKRSVFSSVTSPIHSEVIKMGIDHHNFSSDISRLHKILHRKKEELFPSVSLRDKLHEELITVQRHFNFSRNICSPLNSHFQKSSSHSLVCSNDQSANCENERICKVAAKESNSSPASFKLEFCSEFNCASSPQNSWLFSGLQENEIFGNEEESKHYDEQSLLQYAMDFNQRISPFCQLPELKLNSSASCISPDFDGLSPWKPEFSPLKLPRDSPSPSWHFSRCKMY